jgi:hypothetical protein
LISSIFPVAATGSRALAADSCPAVAARPSRCRQVTATLHTSVRPFSAAPHTAVCTVALRRRASFHRQVAADFAASLATMRRPVFDASVQPPDVAAKQFVVVMGVPRDGAALVSRIVAGPRAPVAAPRVALAGAAPGAPGTAAGTSHRRPVGRVARRAGGKWRRKSDRQCPSPSL